MPMLFSQLSVNLSTYFLKVPCLCVHPTSFLLRLSPLWLHDREGGRRGAGAVIEGCLRASFSPGSPTHARAMPPLICKPDVVLCSMVAYQVAEYVAIPCECSETLQSWSFRRLASQLACEFFLCRTPVGKTVPVPLHRLDPSFFLTSHI